MFYCKNFIGGNFSMKVARKYFCWLLVLVMLWTVSLGGCGGSSTSSLSNGDGNNQTSPNGNGNNNENGVEGSIEGTWRIESGTYTGSSNGMNISATYKPGSATAEQFTIAVTDTVKTNDNPYEGDYTITLSGTGVIVNENNLTYIEADFTSDSPYITDENLKKMMIIQGSRNYNLTGTNNYNWGVSTDGGEGTYTIRLTDSSTLHSIIESTYGGHFVLDVTFKRVTE